MATKKINKLENDLISIKNKMKDIDQLTLNNILETTDISKGQCTGRVRIIVSRGLGHQNVITKSLSVYDMIRRSGDLCK